MPGSEGLARSTTVDVDGSLAEALWKETVQKVGENANAGETIRPRGPTLPAQPEPTEPPSLPGYELLNELGQGGMGVVYRAREESLRREVAVKLIRSGTGGAEARDRFLAEARTTAALDHPNIVPVHELGETPEGQLYLGMKLVSGSSWRALLHPSNDAERELAKGYGLERHLRVLLSVMNAVAFAHRKGIIHRDLKPENVMVGEFGEVLVMDWGLAVAFEDGVAEAHHRSTITDLAGSPAYMSPELAEVRTRELGPPTDVYLLGAILHEILVGRPPHQGERLVDVLRAAARSDPPPFGPDVPAELAAIATRALDRQPSRRFASVRDMQTALEGYLEHRESARIAADARARLATAPPAGRERYDALAEAIAGFHQARLLWDGNEDARRGEEEARLAYARAALESNDLALAGAQVARLSPELPAGRELAARVREALAQRERARRTALAMRAFAVGSLVAMVVGLTAGIYVVSNARDAALAARDSAARARADAEQQRALAEERLRGQNRNLARVYLEKGLRAGSGQDLLAAEVLFARSLELDPVPATRELVASVRLRGASQAWRCPDPAPIRDLCWSPDGAALAVAHVDSYGSVLRVWDVAASSGSTAPASSASRFEVRTQEPLGALAWSRDGAELAAWCQRGDLVRWNAATGAFVSSLSRPADAISLQWSPTLGRFASLGRNRMLG
ncbi:MAG TPA: serine/threonine-protein kinase, partial [Planctomycetota bacterium]|nr:serine/threonine-protein kinase [Planctomycetota bacterium]